MTIHQLSLRLSYLLTALAIVSNGGCANVIESVIDNSTPGEKVGFGAFLAWTEGGGQGRSATATTPPQLFVGAPFGQGAKPGTGVVYRYEQSGSQWTSSASLFDASATGEQHFGSSFMTRGNDLVIGAPFASNQGRAFVWTQTGSTWTQQAVLKATDAQTDDNFGAAVAIDGNRALVAAPFEDTVKDKAGAVYAFTRSGTTWTQSQKLLSSSPAIDDLFGEAVLLDGTEALIASIDPNGPQNYGGRVIQWNLVSGTWVEGVTLRPGDPSYGKGFGSCLARQGAWLVVGAPKDGQTASSAGAAYVFERVGSNWIERQKLRANDGAADHRFGISASIMGDRIAVGAVDANGKQNGAGAVYVFERTGSTWTFATKLIASDGKTGDRFGSCCAVNGNQVSVGAPNATVNGFTFAGKGYVYTLLAPVGQTRVLTEARNLVLGH